MTCRFLHLVCNIACRLRTGSSTVFGTHALIPDEVVGIWPVPSNTPEEIGSRGNADGCQRSYVGDVLGRTQLGEAGDGIRGEDVCHDVEWKRNDGVFGH